MSHSQWFSASFRKWWLTQAYKNIYILFYNMKYVSKYSTGEYLKHLCLKNGGANKWLNESTKLKKDNNTNVVQEHFCKYQKTIIVQLLLLLQFIYKPLTLYTPSLLYLLTCFFNSIYKSTFFRSLLPFICSVSLLLWWRTFPRCGANRGILILIFW